MRGGGSPAASDLPSWSKKAMHERKLGARMAASMTMPSSSSAFRRSPAIVFFLGIFLLVAIVLRSNTNLADHNHNHHHYRHDDVVRVTTGLVRQAQHEYAKLSASSSVFKYPSRKSLSPSPSANNDSLSSLKELVKEAMDRGLVVIVNASEGDAARLFADNAHGARRDWDINGALDGPTGEILAEVIQELRNMEELQQELADLKAKMKRSNVDDEGKVAQTKRAACGCNVLVFSAEFLGRRISKPFWESSKQGPELQILSARTWFGRALPRRKVVLHLFSLSILQSESIGVLCCNVLFSGSCILWFRGNCRVPRTPKFSGNRLNQGPEHFFWKKIGSKRIASSQVF